MRDYSAIPHDPYLTVGDLYQQQPQPIQPQIPPSWFTDQRSPSNRYQIWQQPPPLTQQDLAPPKGYNQQVQQNWPPAPPPPPPAPPSQTQLQQVQQVEQPKIEIKAVESESESKSESEEEEETDATTPEPAKVTEQFFY